jgi:hypothetical protein
MGLIIIIMIPLQEHLYNYITIIIIIKAHQENHVFTFYPFSLLFVLFLQKNRKSKKK